MFWIYWLWYLFPEYRSVFFNRWSCHGCVEEGVPSVTRMNVGFGVVTNGVDLAAQDHVTIL